MLFGQGVSSQGEICGQKCGRQSYIWAYSAELFWKNNGHPTWTGDGVEKSQGVAHRQTGGGQANSKLVRTEANFNTKELYLIAELGTALRASVSTTYRSTAVQHDTKGSQQQYNTYRPPFTCRSAVCEHWISGTAAFVMGSNVVCEFGEVVEVWFLMDGLTRGDI